MLPHSRDRPSFPKKRITVVHRGDYARPIGTSGSELVYFIAERYKDPLSVSLRRHNQSYQRVRRAIVHPCRGNFNFFSWVGTAINQEIHDETVILDRVRGRAH